MSHSEIHGSAPACGFPWLIAACCVLHRLLAPRHSPFALSSLITKLPRSSSLLKKSRSLSVTVIYMPLINLYVVVKEHSRVRLPRLFGPAQLLPGKVMSTSGLPSIARPERRMVGVTGFEPVTLRLSSACSNQLSYRPTKFSELTI